MDDLLAGADDEVSAAALCQSLRSLLSRAGFELKKWRSSSPRVLQSIPTDLQEVLPQQELIDHHASAYPKALGIAWDSRKDAMAAQVQLPETYISTKRGIVSDTAKSFDILGWLSPFILNMKLLFQHLWKLKLDWDTPLEKDLAEKHKQWREQLPLLKSVTVPRCYFDPGITVSTQLHGFSDASEKAYAAVVYLRATYLDGSVSSRLVVAKTKVAPLHTISIPRLELCGAAMLAELMTVIGRTLDIKKDEFYAWCDNTTVLCWLGRSPSNYGTFVANRVSSASSSVSPKNWLYVPTKENPADCASRGISALELLHHDLWWEGPPWLRLEPVAVPKQPDESELVQHQEEEAKPKAVFSVTRAIDTGWEKNYNNYSVLLHTTAYMLRFCNNLKAAIKGLPGERSSSLLVSEVEAAEMLLFKRSQARAYETELKRLAAATPKPIEKGSVLRLVHPYLDSRGLMLVRGRLNQANLSHMQKHPVILSSSDMVTRLYFLYHHCLLAHCGPTLLLAHTGQAIYVPGAKKLARTVCQSCLVCRRAAPRAHLQRMGQLPAPRVTQLHPFSHCGIDFAGPFYLKRGNPRRPTITKGYLGLFVCLATKVVHIEVVSSLSTGAFISALKRFCTRAGKPQHIYSDHGSNFIGARNQLKELYQFLNNATTHSDVTQCLLERRITWHHIPERAPHFGGIWESSVKAAKHCLKRTVGVVKLTYEELTTITCQAEACLNSRPYVAQDSHYPSGEMPLTRGHFLIGRPMEAYPEAPEPPDTNLSNCWELCKAMVQQFWEIWQKQYLQTLQKSLKWHKTQPNIQVGDIVMVLEESKL